MAIGPSQLFKHCLAIVVLLWNLACHCEIPLPVCIYKLDTLLETSFRASVTLAMGSLDIGFLHVPILRRAHKNIATL